MAPRNRSHAPALNKILADPQSSRILPWHLIPSDHAGTASEKPSCDVALNAWLVDHQSWLKRMLLGHSRSYGIKAQIIEDVVQDTLLLAFLHSEWLSLQTELKRQMWLALTAKHVMQLYRREHRQEKKVREVLLYVRTETFLQCRQELLTSGLLVTYLRQCLAQLPQRQRQIISGVYIRGQPLARLAVDLNICVHTARNLLGRGCKSLKDRLLRLLRLFELS